MQDFKQPHLKRMAHALFASGSDVQYGHHTPWSLLNHPRELKSGNAPCTGVVALSQR